MKRTCEDNMTEENQQDSIKYARSSRGPILASNGKARNEYENLTCYGCERPLYYRKDHKRSRNGITYDVNACFTHGSTNGCNGGGESYYHLAAKDAIIHNACIQFTTECRVCDKIFQIDARKGAIRAIPEWRWKNFVLDVAFLGNDDVLVGAVEVYYTHAVSDEKKKTLSENGVAWVEIGAISVLDALQSNKDVSVPLPVIDCAMHAGCCWQCDIKCTKEEDAMREAVRRETLQNKNEKRGKDEKLTFGKFTGLSIETVWKSDPDYIRWLTGFSGYREGNKPIVENRPKCITPAITMKSREIVMAHCLLCFKYLGDKTEKWKRWCAPCYKDSECM